MLWKNSVNSVEIVTGIARCKNVLRPGTTSGEDWTSYPGDECRARNIKKCGDVQPVGRTDTAVPKRRNWAAGKRTTNLDLELPP